MVIVALLTALALSLQIVYFFNINDNAAAFYSTKCLIIFPFWVVAYFLVDKKYNLDKAHRRVQIFFVFLAPLLSIPVFRYFPI